MVLIFGLGNPGKKFKGTRHNLGREMVELLQRKWGFSAWQKKVKLEAEISEGKFQRKKILLAKSLIFMNESGRSAKKIAQNYKIPSQNLWVLQDEFDLALGKIKIVKNRGSAGHKGIDSIIKELGTKNFVRFRIGIKAKQKVAGIAEKFVLKKFPKDEKKIIKKAIERTIEAIEIALEESIEKAMQKYN